MSMQNAYNVHSYYNVVFNVSKYHSVYDNGNSNYKAVAIPGIVAFPVAIRSFIFVFSSF